MSLEMADKEAVETTKFVYALGCIMLFGGFLLEIGELGAVLRAIRSAILFVLGAG